MSSLVAKWLFPQQQQQKPTPPPPPAPFPFLSTTIGASVDAFYRSAMNAKLNARLTNKKAPLFPNMHIQTPTRILYINGIKNIRLYLEQRKPEWLKQGYSKDLVQYGTAIAPGVLMTPFSSILEASNAGHMNPEPMALRAMRGLIPRTLREVIFAIGLNEVSDYFQEHVPSQVENKALRNIVGSITAGIFSGYLSHVPHNLSTLKLLKPQISYGQHFDSLLNTAIESRFTQPDSVMRTSSLMKKVVGTALVFTLPRGVVIRSMQIAGSFVIVNGAILALTSIELDRKARDYAKTALYAPVPATTASK